MQKQVKSVSFLVNRMFPARSYCRGIFSLSDKQSANRITAFNLLEKRAKTSTAMNDRRKNELSHYRNPLIILSWAKWAPSMHTFWFYRISNTVTCSIQLRHLIGGNKYQNFPQSIWNPGKFIRLQQCYKLIDGPIKMVLRLLFIVKNTIYASEVDQRVSESRTVI